MCVELECLSLLGVCRLLDLCCPRAWVTVRVCRLQTRIVLKHASPTGVALRRRSFQACVAYMICVVLECVLLLATVTVRHVLHQARVAYKTCVVLERLVKQFGAV